MAGHGRRLLKLWLGALCSIAVAWMLVGCPVQAPQSGGASAPGTHARPQAASVPAKSPLSAQQVMDKLGLKWQYTDPPVVVFHNPG